MSNLNQEQNVKHQFSNITTNMISSNPFPRLKGSSSEIRRIVGPLATVFAKHMSWEDENHRNIALGLHLSMEIEQILDASDGAASLSKDAQKKFEKTVFDFLAVVTTLSKSFHDKGLFYFNFTIKNHFLAHIAILSRHLNPRVAWCYSCEDFMKHVKRLVQSSSWGAKPWTVSRRVMSKYINGLGMLLLGQKAWCA